MSGASGSAFVPSINLSSLVGGVGRAQNLRFCAVNCLHIIRSGISIVPLIHYIKTFCIPSKLTYITRLDEVDIMVMPF